MDLFAPSSSICTHTLFPLSSTLISLVLVTFPPFYQHIHWNCKSENKFTLIWVQFEFLSRSAYSIKSSSQNLLCYKYLLVLSKSKSFTKRTFFARIASVQNLTEMFFKFSYNSKFDWRKNSIFYSGLVTILSTLCECRKVIIYRSHLVLWSTQSILYFIVGYYQMYA